MANSELLFIRDFLEIARIALIVAYVFLFLLGAMLMLNPESLERINRLSNRWVKIDSYVFARHPKIFGTVFIAIAILTIVLLLR